MNLSKIPGSQNNRFCFLYIPFLVGLLRGELLSPRNKHLETVIVAVEATNSSKVLQSCLRGVKLTACETILQLLMSFGSIATDHCRTNV